MCPAATSCELCAHFGVNCILSTTIMVNELGVSHCASECPHVSNTNSTKSESCFTFGCNPEPTPHPDSDRFPGSKVSDDSSDLTDDARESPIHPGSHMEASQTIDIVVICFHGASGCASGYSHILITHKESVGSEHACPECEFEDSEVPTMGDEREGINAITFHKCVATEHSDESSLSVECTGNANITMCSFDGCSYGDNIDHPGP